MSPPIEATKAEMNHPPYIDEEFLRPQREVLRLISAPEEGVVRLSVETLLDPNPEPALYYAWIGNRSGLIEQSEVGRQGGQASLYRNVFYAFGRVELELDPCSERLRGAQSETIWLFVADRRFVRITGERVEVEAGGYIERHGWLLEFSPALCLD